MIVTAGMMLIWLAVVPVFPNVAGAIANDPETVRWATTAFSVLFVPYVLLSFNTVMDSVFLWHRADKVSCIPGVLTNGSVYLIAFLLYISGVWQVTFEGVMVLFSLGILVDSLLTLAFLIKALYVDSARLAEYVQ